MARQNIPLGIWLMALTSFIFALQDGISRHLAAEYNVMMVIMVRYWFFAAFVLTLARRKPGGIAAAAQTSRPALQAFRGVVLVIEINVMVLAFVKLGLVESHAVFAVYPLIVAALSGPVLGEQVGWRRWTAIGVGFVGVLIILQPSGGVFSVHAAIPLLAAGLFALYGLLTRYVARDDDAQTSFFYTGVAGGVAATVIGLWFWQNMRPGDWGWMGLLCVLGVAGHYTLIRSYDVAEASAVQPFAYLHLVFASALGILVFSETLRLNVAIGAGLIVAAGVFTLLRARKRGA